VAVAAGVIDGVVVTTGVAVILGTAVGIAVGEITADSVPVELFPSWSANRGEAKGTKTNRHRIVVKMSFVCSIRH